MQTAKLFKFHGSQAVLLSKTFYFEGEEVTVKRFGSGVLLMPIESPWQIIQSALDEFEPGFKRFARVNENKIEENYYKY